MPDTVQAGGSLAIAARHIIENCGCTKSGERVLVIADSVTQGLGDALLQAALERGAKGRLAVIDTLTRHGEEPDAELAVAMAQASLVVGITRFSMAHSRARIAAAAAGARYLSLPDYSPMLMSDPSIMIDYKAQSAIVRRVADRLTAASHLHVTSPGGTDIRIDVRGRIANACPGFVEKAGDLGSPPDVEANISPVEDASEGEVVVDGSIPFPGFGLLAEPLRLTVERGEIRKFEGDAAMVERLEALFGKLNSRKAYVLAECGIGLNPQAELKGIMLTDEGSYGSVHFGFGSNSTVGGKNDVPIHIDFVFRKGTIMTDGKPLMKEGVLA
jgi:2,5-dihydroxypyridine 5,6-dioxygenase